MRSTVAVLPERPTPDGTAATSPRPDATRARAALSDAELLAEIGRSLTAVYVEFLQQPIPRRTADVLDRIKVSTLV